MELPRSTPAQRWTLALKTPGELIQPWRRGPRSHYPGFPVWVSVLASALLLALSGCITSAQAQKNATGSQTPTRSPAGSLPSPAAPTTTRLPSAEPRSTTLPPSQTPSPSPVPLTDAAVAACPVTLPNGKVPSRAAGSNFDHGNERGTLFTIPWPAGRVIFEPDGPGFIEPDGSLAMKWPWYWEGVKGALTLSGRRLDAPAPPLRAEIPCCYGDQGFQPSMLIFSTEGCWEITARVADESLTIVVLAIKE